MDLILILGPMKSGKSLTLIKFFNSLDKNVKFGVFQPVANVRDDNVRSRNGLKIESTKINTFAEIINDDLEIIGVDEIHMFPREEIKYIKKILKQKKKIIISGLDRDYQGKIFPIIKELINLSPKKIYLRKARCEICGQPAEFNQILKNNQPILKGLPASVPDDGTYEYKTVCRKCFIK